MTMRCGLFGKLGSKRDFIALATPRSFLEVWEPWMQAALSASRHQLGERWQQAFLTAPVWRFWLGAAICGTTVAGAVMPSLDGVGRYYPLTLLAVADADAAIAPPELDPQDAWFAAAEDFLLSTLASETSFEAVSVALDALAPPQARSRLASSGGIVSLGDGLAGKGTAEGEFASAFSMLREASSELYAAASFWWTAGGHGFSPLALGCRGLPEPYHYSRMLTGDIGNVGDDARLV